MKLGCVVGVCLAATGWAGTFGKVVAIGGHASDLALDEARGVLYVANFGANRIEVIRTRDLILETSMNVGAQPSSLALSPDGRWLVIAHFGNFQAPSSPNNLLTVIELDTRARQTFALGSPPLGVAFGANGNALIVTTTDFLRFDPPTGMVETIATIEEVTANTLPAPPPQAPPQIVAASLAVSADRLWIYGLTDTIRFSYDVAGGYIRSLGYTATPPLGPRVVSVSRDGSSYAAGWGLFHRDGTLLAQFPNAAGLLHVGSHGIDSARGVVWAQIPEAEPETDGESGQPTGTPAVQAPVLAAADIDNLAVRERFKLAENLAGKSVLASDGSVLYAISDSGVTALPVGSLDRERRIAVSHEDLMFRGSFCDRGLATQEITITDPGGGRTDFALSSTHSGISVSPDSGTTPAKVRVTVDPAAFQNQQGTVVANIEISSGTAVNIPPPVRVLVNSRQPDQRGTIVNVPGKLVDILADPARDRFYVLRQDRNEVLVFDGSNYTKTATLKTGNTPTQLAITLDRRYLLVGADNSQIAHVYDLDTLQPQAPIRFPPGHYPRSLAASGRAILAAVRSASSDEHKIDRVDLGSRRAVEYASLGPWENKVHVNTMLVASGSGASILGAQADGSVLLYEATADTFTTWRKDFATLGGAYAASPDGRFVVDNHVLNASLVPVHHFETSTGASSGFAFADEYGFRTTAPNGWSAGVIQRIELQKLSAMRPTRTSEAPGLQEQGGALLRTLAVLSNRRAIVSLGVSGLTVLPWTYEVAVAPPKIDRVVNAADLSAALAPGSLISVFGRDLNPVSAATSEMPLPTALAESCLTANGVPVPMLFVSPEKVNAQLPYYVAGAVTLVLRTPGGASDNYSVAVSATAPAVFRAAVSGTDELFPTVVRATNNLLVTWSNPIHRGEAIVIYAGGMGRTIPEVEAGAAAPLEPPAVTGFVPEVELGGEILPLMFAGLTPGLAGVYQINVLVPDWVVKGMAVPLTIRQGGASTTVAVRVVD